MQTEDGIVAGRGLPSHSRLPDETQAKKQEKYINKKNLRAWRAALVLGARWSTWVFAASMGTR